jgi:hypothetical protein
MTDIAPDATGTYKECRTIRMKWARVYQYYEEFCLGLNYETVPYNRFVAIRKEHCPYFIRHRKAAGRMTWNHMECTTCTELDTAIRKCPKKKDPMRRKELEKELEAHWADQEVFRNHYAMTVAKAIENKDRDLVMHIDGGEAGTSFQPFFFQDVSAGEALPHFCMKVKNTFVQIHGWGSLVFQSYPVLEEMSTNLIIEVMFS